MKLNGNTILITGGGSGIGEALAHRFADAGNVVIIAGRRREALDKAASGRDAIHVRTFDAGDGAAVKPFAEALVRDFPGLNVLVNNAGVMTLEDASAKRDLTAAEETVAINLLGPIRLIDALVDQLTGQPDAAIINVSSGLAFVPLAMAPVYSATKAAIHSYTLSLREVLRGHVELIELPPPGVQTDLTPGQATRPGYQPLTEFADEAFALLREQPTPAEILVERVRPMRLAEREGRTEAMVSQVNAFARQMREAGPQAR